MKAADARLAQRKRLLAMIHIARQQVGMSDDEYRDLLGSMFAGQRSAATLDWFQLEALLGRFKLLGFKAVSAKKSGAKRLDSSPQSKMARGLWIELHQLGAVRDPSEAALASYVKRMTRVDRLEWLNHKQIELVIESLKKWLDRVSHAQTG